MAQHNHQSALKAHSRHMDRLRALSKQVDDASASAEETSRLLQRTRKALEEERERSRIVDTHAERVARHRKRSHH